MKKKHQPNNAHITFAKDYNSPRAQYTPEIKALW